MKNTFQFSRLGLAVLLADAVVLGGYLVLLTIGSLGMLIGKLGRAWQKAPP